MSSNNLIVIALTGLLLFAYTFVRNNSELLAPQALDYLRVAVLICGSLAVVNLISFLIVDVWLARSQGKAPSSLLKLVISLVLYTVCGLTVGRALGWDVTALFATSALVTVVAGLALRSTLSDFLSGIALRLDQPFQLGDRISVRSRSDDFVGKVVSITWRAVGLRGNTGIVTYVPNSVVAECLVSVIPLDGRTYRFVPFLAPATAPPNQVSEAVRQALSNQLIPNINPDRPILVWLWEHGRKELEPLNSLLYQVIYCPLDYHGARRTDSEILRRTWYALQRAQLSPEYAPPQRETYLDLVRNLEFWQGLNLAAHKVLLQRATRLLFDTGERLSAENLPPHSLFLVVKGTLEVEQQLQETAAGVAAIAFTRRPDYHIPVPLEAATVEQVAERLAYYLGPAAFELTQEMSQGISSLYWLYQKLAAEIPSEVERTAFMRSSPPRPSEQLHVGDCFGELCLFLGEPLATATITVLRETELLAIAPPALKAALDCDPEGLAALSQSFTRYQEQYLAGTLQYTAAPLAGDVITARLQTLYASTATS